MTDINGLNCNLLYFLLYSRQSDPLIRKRKVLLKSLSSSVGQWNWFYPPGVAV